MSLFKRRILPFLLCLTLTVSGFTGAASSAETEKQTVSVSLSNIYDLAYKNNVSAKIAQSEWELFDKNAKDLSDALDAAWNSGSSSSSVMQMLMSQQSSSETREITKLSTENAKKQAALGSKSMLISYYSLQNQLIQLKGSKEVSVRNLNSVKIRKSLGLATDIDVENLEQALKKLDDAVSDTTNAITVLKSNLSIYIGVSEDKFEISPFESETSENLLKAVTAYDYKADLALALKNCYRINMQKLASDDRSSKRSSLDYMTYEDLKAKFPVAFKEAYDALKTKAASLRLAEASYATSKKTADAAAVKFKFGIVSQKDNQDALTKLEHDKCELTAAQLEYALALNNYQAMKDGIWVQ